MIHRQLAESIGQDFSEDVVTQFLEVLIFIPAMAHAAAKPFHACWRPDSEEASKTKSSVKSGDLILLLPIVTRSLIWLSLSIQLMQIIEKRGDKTHLCQRPTAT